MSTHTRSDRRFQQSQDGNQSQISSPSTEIELSINGSSIAPLSPTPSIFTSWWWWEIGSCIVSLIGLGLVTFILSRVDNEPVSSWPYSIRPNSLVSVITTVTKASMMVPIALCLSQLKWDHFQYRPNTLHHLQIYDDASRGPWGCFSMVATGHLKALSAWALALLTLAALGIEPSIQQTLELVTRQAPSRNATGEVEISKAGAYSSRGLESGSIGSDRSFVRTLISNGVLGSVQDHHFSCPEPTVECRWGKFDTLAVCANYTNTTEAVRKDCRSTRHNTYDNVTCTFTFPEGKRVSLANRTDDPDNFQRLGTSQYCTSSGPGYDVVNFDGACAAGPNILNGVRVMYWRWTDDQGDSHDLNWCARTYHNTIASPARIQAVNYTSDPIIFYNSSYPDPYPGVYATYYLYSNSSVQYAITLKGLTLLDGRLSLDNGSDSSFGQFLYTTDLRNFTANLEETLTNLVRSSPNDNFYSATLSGRAFCQETYWRVHWQWIILPVVESVITVLLGVTIMFSKNRPLYKSSPLALLFHPLEGYEENRLVHGIQDNSASKLEDIAGSMRVEFKKDENGILKFLAIKNRNCGE
ncbi:hypothetical protein F5Y09DRAFT_331681 [Xylaria sp. FL1042]|nr:hypothetical protein F5Y09DRAFT_331681 [Xylaria sp. FL1042]